MPGASLVRRRAARAGARHAGARRRQERCV